MQNGLGQLNFVQAWKEVIDDRRKQLKQLARIQAEMSKETYSSRNALAIRT